MRIAILTNEYPPNVYGGAGVHVSYLAHELTQLNGGAHSIRVFCFGDQRQEQSNLSVRGISATHSFSAHDLRHEKFLDTMFKDIVMAGQLGDVDVIHCHTWYSHLAGLLAKQLLEVPLVLTTHSLEPHRPWKVEQLGSAYYASSWIEKTAYENADGVIAVSESMRQDVHGLYHVPLDKIRVIHNGIDIREYQPTHDQTVLAKYGINPQEPYILFVGRVTRQKGIIHLVNAIHYLHSDCQVVLCAGAPDTPDMSREMNAKIAQAKRDSKNKIIWIADMVPKKDLIAIYSQASVFVCPSVYEPFGIINLEAMACQTPVVATAVGGIREVVIPGETGMLVPIHTRGAHEFEPADPEKFSRDLAHAIQALLSSGEKLKHMGEKARQRVVDHFSWTKIAGQTLDFYKALV